ncbi:hypothetical protein K402DRAFT_392489 [Aulographum hederae CBS 113979]|uniref:Uncharacterized protein n=1 Tax=Aulographum hederae CBS 113979 TaxID=1176131 RepID=A0A6G1H3F3_9PEZI|nr:hypothetical protein K402DRAFT_392489 [Aulographum hederae CBS 113979]
MALALIPNKCAYCRGPRCRHLDGTLGMGPLMPHGGMMSGAMMPFPQLPPPPMPPIFMDRPVPFPYPVPQMIPEIRPYPVPVPRFPEIDFPDFPDFPRYRPHRCHCPVCDIWRHSRHLVQPPPPHIRQRWLELRQRIHNGVLNPGTLMRIENLYAYYNNKWLDTGSYAYRALADELSNMAEEAQYDMLGNMW